MKMYGTVAVATFAMAVGNDHANEIAVYQHFYKKLHRCCKHCYFFAFSTDFNSLVQKSRMMPFPQGNQVIIISPMKLPDTVVVSGIPENTQEFVIQLYFQQSAPVKKVKLVPPNKALVTFENHESMLKFLLHFVSVNAVIIIGLSNQANCH